MKKTSILITSIALSAMLFGSTAMAAKTQSGHDQQGQLDPGPMENHGKQEKDTKKDKDDATVTSDTYGHGHEGKIEDKDDGTVTSDTYGHGHKGYIGLERAFENVKDKPAGERIAELLATKYGITEMAELLKQMAGDLEQGVDEKDGNNNDTTVTVTLTPEQLKAKKEELKAYAKALHEKIKEQLQALKNGEITLADLADLYASVGSVTDAVYVQKQAIHINLHNLNSYKKLGELYEKQGKTGVKAYVNGEEPEFDVAPVIKDGSSLVPFRAISEALKAEVSWNEDEKSVTVTKDGIVVKLILGSTTAYVNGKEVTLEVPGQLLSGRTVVPVRFISEAFKAQVDWEPVSQSVVINAQTIQ
jgi:hypothetical protein